MQLPTLPRSISETHFAFVDVEGDHKENDASTKNKPCKLDDITSLLRGSALFLTFRKQIVAKCQQRKRVFCKWWRADAIVSSSTASQCHFIAMHFCFISFKAASLLTIEEASKNARSSCNLALSSNIPARSVAMVESIIFTLDFA